MPKLYLCARCGKKRGDKDVVKFRLMGEFFGKKATVLDDRNWCRDCWPKVSEDFNVRMGLSVRKGLKRMPQE